MNAFEEQYIKVREKEGRIYEDAVVKRLPNVESSHIHYREWKKRRRSADQLLRYLEQKQKPLNILEVGCGNGWLANRLASNKEFKVTGIDINTRELMQAKRVFAENPRVTFIYGDMKNMNLRQHAFDVIIFASSIQYFESLEEMVNASKKIVERKWGAAYTRLSFL